MCSVLARGRIHLDVIEIGMLGRQKGALPWRDWPRASELVVVLNATKPPPEVAAEPPKAINVTELAQRVTAAVG